MQKDDDTYLGQKIYFETTGSNGEAPIVMVSSFGTRGMDSGISY
ncbi:hypothetical protein J2X31_003364 [Flavobacterium arsenatis]|uniref:Uncharacterized protein n=1 Tax=Flavobacterium arsenatis TaxID=1484332 RepID=A0ABU1TTX8_9FLAO|nr:hypothetical protein [Flavobacterium arsenatis]MDR6969334.1 hypothetical protein [Flavobacterium arsenatis]